MCSSDLACGLAENRECVPIYLRLRADGNHCEKICRIMIEGSGEVLPNACRILVEAQARVIAAIGHAAEHPGPVSLARGVKSGDGIRERIVEPGFLIGDRAGNARKRQAESCRVRREILLDRSGSMAEVASSNTQAAKPAPRTDRQADRWWERN